MGIYAKEHEPREIWQLSTLHHRAEQKEREAREEQHKIEEKVDELRLAARPTFPTAQQVAGIVVAAVQVHNHVVPKSHHGDSLGHGFEGVNVAGSLGGDASRVGRIQFNHDSPFSARRIGSKLWSFADDEISALLALVEEQKLRIIKHWRHDYGVSVHVTSDQKEEQE